VPARNEEKNIQTCLESLSVQSYPKVLYEVIVIDDHSTDRTGEVVNHFSEEGDYAGNKKGSGQAFDVRCIRLADFDSGDARTKAYKKFAIETGIRISKGELIVTTDADCRFDPDWLATLAGFYEDCQAKFIAAPVRIDGNDSFLSVFQTLDFITLQGITGAAVNKQFHSMCNGANLAYEKAAFYEVDGFRGIDSIPSGDDMLLMHKIYEKYPRQVCFLKHTKAIVATNAETRWSGFFNQRIRWASKADQYDDKRIFWVLLLVFIVNLLFLVLLIATITDSRYLWVLLAGLVVKTLVEYPFVRSVSAFFGQQRLMIYFPVLQPFHILYTVVIGWLGQFGSYRWKDRKISK